MENAEPPVRPAYSFSAVFARLASKIRLATLKQYLINRTPLGWVSRLVMAKALPAIMRGITLVSERIKLWRALFQAAPPKQKVIMASKPVGAALLVWLLLTVGPYFLPPSLATSFPDQEGEEIPLNSTVELVFDRPIIKSTVEKNFRLEPTVPGTISWEGDQKLVFTPSQPLERDKQYTAKVGGLIFSSYFVPMFGQPAVKFTTLGHPKIVLSSPDTEALEDSAPITVVFDRAMIPLTTATNSALKQPAFTISPNIAGEGRWLGTTAYQFRPAQRLKKATTFTVTVPQGMASQDGGTLQTAFEWQFSSQRPRVNLTSPVMAYQYASPTASVAAILSQAVDRDSAQEHFKLYDANKQPVSGTVKVVGQIVGFHPSAPLRREAEYTAVLTAGLQGTEGPNGLETDYEWDFKIAAAPEITATNPENGATQVQLTNELSVHFKTPMDEDSLADYITIDPAPAVPPQVYFSAYGGKNVASIRSYFGRSTTYTITVSPGAKDQYGVPLQAGRTFSFTTAPYNPSITLYPSGTYFGAFNQQVTPRIVAQVINANSVNYSLYKLDLTQFRDLYERRMVGKCASDNRCSTWQSYDPKQLTKVRDWSEQYEGNFNVPVHVITKVTDAAGANIPPGMYFLDASIGDGSQHDNMVMIVSKTVLTVKKSDNQIFVWAVDQATGQTVPGMKIKVLHTSNSVLAEGMTNNDGVFQANAELKGKSHLIIYGEKDGEQVVVSDQWDEGIESSSFGLPYHYDADSYSGRAKQAHKLFVVLDRPIYRPGHTVRFKGVVRTDADGAYDMVAAGEEVTVTVTNSEGKSVFTDQLTTNSYGTFSGEFEVSQEASLGEYSIRVKYSADSFSQPFQVEEYRKPEVSVSLTPSKPEYVAGESAVVDVQASYYFGAPVSNAPTSWIVKSQDYSFRWDKDRRFEFGDSDTWGYYYWFDQGSSSYFSGKVVTEGVGSTNAAGELRIGLPLSPSDNNVPQRYQIEATVNDLSNQSIASSEEIIVHPGEIYAGVHPESYSNKVGVESKIELVTLNYLRQELPNTPVEVEFYKRTWESVKELSPETGAYYYVSKHKDALISTTSVTTNELARGIATFTPPEGGVFRVVAKATDGSGRVTRSSSTLWVSGSGLVTPRENNDRIVLVTDKSEYLVGETASLFVATPFASESAKTLLTMERGSVLEYRVVDTSETSNNFAIPIVEHDVPNVFFGALLVRPGMEVKKPAEIKMGYAEAKVTDQRQKLLVSISPDQARYKPGQQLKATVRVTDATGAPAQTELAVGLVDKAVWDLSGIRPAEIYDAFYLPRRLSVYTSQLLTMSIDRINANTNLGAKGGSGGGGGGEGFDTTRTNFPDTAFWQAHIMTDAAGLAQLDIPLPDSLTTWKLTAIAVSGKSAFGTAATEVLVSRDVLIRPFMPRFLAVNDESNLGAIVVNTSGAAQTLTVGIEADGLEVLDLPSQTVTVADGAQAKVTWKTRAQAVESAKVTLKVSAGGTQLDAMQQTLPVKLYSTPEIVATAGEVNDVATQTIVLPAELENDLGEASLTLSPTLAGSAFDGLNYLYNYRYYCTEQISSKVLPALYALQVMEQGELESLSGFSEEELKRIVIDGVQRLVAQQHSDGGWGWWDDEQSQPQLSAYAFETLVTAKAQKLEVDEKVIAHAEEYLRKQLAQAPAAVTGMAATINYSADMHLADRVAVVYALRGRGTNLSSYGNELFNQRFRLSVENRAYLATALKTMSGMQKQASRTYSELLSLAKITATTAHWENGPRAYSYYGSGASTTAAMLETLVAFDQSSPLVTQAMRYLSTTRQNAYWNTTRDTAMVIKAMSQQLLATKGAKVDESFKVLLQNSEVASGAFTKESMFSSWLHQIPVSTLGVGSTNQLSMSKAGEGNLYYNLDLKYYLPYDEIEALDQGIVIVRELVDMNGKILEGNTIPENTEAWMRLIIVAPELRHNVAVEDFLPAGLESVNGSLNNVSTLSTVPLAKQADGSNTWQFNRREYFDDSTAMFASYLPAGVYEVTYRVRATTPGKYHHKAAQAYQMYTPDVSGHSAGGWLTVTPQR